MAPADGVTTIERRTRDERPVRRLFETRTLPGAGEAALWVVVGGVALALLATPVPFVALAWVVVAGVAMVVLRADQSRRPRDRGVQVYDDVARLDARGLGAGVPSSQLFVPYGLVLGWCARRGLVSEWFRQQSVAELDDLAAGRLSVPQLRWRLVYALYESERVAVRRRFARFYAFPD
jgi:hypothetical protein